MIINLNPVNRQSVIIRHPPYLHSLTGSDGGPSVTIYNIIIPPIGWEDQRRSKEDRSLINRPSRVVTFLIPIRAIPFLFNGSSSHEVLFIAPLDPSSSAYPRLLLPLIHSKDT